MAILLLLAGLCSPAVAASERGAHYTATRWDMQDGLPHNLVHAVTQDAQGFIWAVTWEGVARFNGRTFTVHDNENTETAELSGVFAVLAEKDGSLLVGTAHDGIYRFRNGHWLPVGKGPERGVRVDQMLRTRDGSFWFSSRDRLLRLHDNGKVEDVGKRLGLSPAYIHALAEDNGALVVGTTRGAWVLRDGQFQRWGATRGLDAQVIRQIHSDRKGGWVVLGDEQVWRWQKDGEVQHIRPGRRIEAVMVDRHDAVWMSFANGELVRQGGGLPDWSIQLGGLASRALMEDREGLIWVGNSIGLYQLIPGAAQALTAADGLGNAYVRTVLQDDGGTVWVGHVGGLDRWRDGRIEPVALGAGANRSHTVTALALDRSQGGLWVGTFDLGVLRLDADGQVRERIPVSVDGERSLLIRSLLPCPHGLLLGTQMGLMHYRNGRIEDFGAKNGLPSESVHAISVDRRGAIWIGTASGLARIDTDGSWRFWKPRTELPAQSVFDFHHDRDGTVWMATDAGVLRWRDDHIRQYDHNAGLPRDKVFRIIDDGLGRFWLSSNQGVFRVARGEFDGYDRDRHDQLLVDVVDSSDGMPSTQVNGATWPAGWLHSDGRLMFPTGEGLALIDPDLAGRGNQRLPPVVFEQVSVNGQRQVAASAYRLHPQTSRLSISYVALGYATPRKLRYRYRLAGFDKEWIEAGDTTEAVYTNLPAGDYRFQVQAMAMPLDWDDADRVGMAELRVVQVAAWWQRPWVWGAAVMSLLGATWIWVLLRARRFARRQSELNALVDARTSELHLKNAALEAAGHERDGLLELLARQVLLDPLTGLPNRRAGDEHLHGACEQARLSGRPLSVALLDVDHFKQVNDTHGHDVGDQVLTFLGMQLQRLAGEGVFVARQGGEEFLLVLPGMPLPEAADRMETVRAGIAAAVLPGDLPLSFTVSIGVAAFGPDQDNQRGLLTAADACLYQAKRTGRNRVQA